MNVVFTGADLPGETCKRVNQLTIQPNTESLEIYALGLNRAKTKFSFPPWSQNSGPERVNPHYSVYPITNHEPREFSEG